MPPSTPADCASAPSKSRCSPFLPFAYQSGQEIRKGDQIIIFHGAPGEIEFVADPEADDPQMGWYVQEYGGGVMILEPKHFGRCFLHRTDTAEDLEFVSRKT
jgi:hypothetical protein